MAAEQPGAGPSGGASRPALFSWCLFDWANSAFPTVVTTFVFAAYFTEAVAPDTASGTAAWGYALSLSGLAVAVLSPIAGAITDHGGRRKPWLFVFSALSILAAAGLWFVRPDASSVVLALVLVGVGSFAFEMATVFYNAMLPEIAPKGMIGRISGWGWGLGYAGGLGCLVVALVLVKAEPPLFGLDAAAAEPVRATALLVALWFAVFGLPLFLFTPDRPAYGLSLIESARRGLATLGRTVKNVRAHGGVVRFLVAHMVYADGLNTLFAFGGIYAAGTFGMDFSELVLFGIATNVTAGAGAALFAWVDDWIGPKRTIMIALFGLLICGAALIMVESKAMFWIFALPLGIFVGPAQAASRSLMAHLAPAEIRTEMFGLFALSGKATAFVGPALLGWVTVLYASQRAGMATVLVFFAAGIALMAKVPDVRR
ncbi:MAG: MFS transporter [Rhodospirillales bacterium]|nr:MFS transporter [Rhodospirillales bacterium]